MEQKSNHTASDNEPASQSSPELTAQESLTFRDKKGREVPFPNFGLDSAILEECQLADTHAHLDMLENPALALARAARAGVRFIATVVDVMEDPLRTFNEIDAWKIEAESILAVAGVNTQLPEVRFVVGAHPHNAQKYLESPDARELLHTLAADPRVCAIGEVGLDYHYDYSPREIQQETYREQVRLAQELNLPIVIHLREAHEQGEAILREVGVPSAGAILHCFNLSADVAQPFMDLGCHVSFAGPATFKKADDVRLAASRIPLGRILTETDSPFMAPEPFRGARCEPALVRWTAARIADVRREAPEVFLRSAYEAAVALLNPSRTA